MMVRSYLYKRNDVWKCVVKYDEEWTDGSVRKITLYAYGPTKESARYWCTADKIDFTAQAYWKDRFLGVIR